jgi:hypothetical protein
MAWGSKLQATPIIDLGSKTTRTSEVGDRCASKVRDTDNRENRPKHKINPKTQVDYAWVENEQTKKKNK